MNQPNPFNQPNTFPPNMESLYPPLPSQIILPPDSFHQATLPEGGLNIKVIKAKLYRDTDFFK